MGKGNETHLREELAVGGFIGERMPALTREQVQVWVDDFLKATSGGGGATPTDWKKLQDLMSKRIAVRRKRILRQSIN